MNPQLMQALQMIMQQGPPQTPNLAGLGMAGGMGAASGAVAGPPMQAPPVNPLAAAVNAGGAQGSPAAGPAPYTAPPMVIEPSTPKLPIGVIAGAPTPASFLSKMNRDELLQQLDAENKAHNEAVAKANAPGKAKKPVKKQAEPTQTILLLSAILEMIEEGSGMKLLEGWGGGRTMKLEGEYANELTKYEEAVAKEEEERRAAALEAQLRGQGSQQILSMLGGIDSSNKDTREHMQDLEKIEATFRGRTNLAGINNQADIEEAIVRLFGGASPELRTSLASRLGFDPTAAGALKPGEKVQEAKAAETRLMLPHRIKKAMAEGKGAELKNALTEAQTRLTTLRGDAQAEKNKWLPKELAAELNKLEAAASKAQKEANDVTYGVTTKPATGTAILNAISKIDEANTKADAALAKLEVERRSIEGRIADLRSGRDKTVTGSMVELKIREAQDALEANEAVQAYWQTMRTRNGERLNRVAQIAANPPAATSTEKKTVNPGGN